ncbi:MAG: MoxR family ATPase [Thermoguttaceae bacterium]|nr:MoxR family ATPase [Thermoguttaceae bacterium]MBQ2039683.1 MoxR family ATPase [Thermoguttaceae bacterium]MBQ2556379.1 MoxR family ATPase [Thermoguttaceae bacterium]MBQ3822372.1 MoxR family ATPase [Thermoguttaceae bacterium]MBQ4079111.1 MoxR family ATPase [Thermoguttaceae bacterium]
MSTERQENERPAKLTPQARQQNLGALLQEFGQTREAIENELAKVVVGQKDAIRQIFAAIFTRGHCLLEGVPGLAKTLTVSTIAKILDVKFRRVQFTPDLTPSDITGSTVLEEDGQGRRSFRFVEGPVFTNILLADEINRTPPKTQSALLQAMQEREVTVGGDTYKLPEPFLVVATQNPIDQEGTYPLPEAQLDRFMFNVKIDYPTLEEEEKILTATTRGETAEPARLLNPKILLGMQRLVSSVAVSQYIIQYATRLVRATRPTDPSSPEFIRDLVDFGAGPRAGQYLVNGGKAFAAMDGRFSVSIEDVKAAAVPVLRKRVGANFQAQAEGMTTDKIVLKLLDTVPTPPIEKYAR